MNLVEQLRHALKSSSENSLLIKKSADSIEQLERKLQSAEVCYKDALDRLQGARNAALEEAANVCEEEACGGSAFNSAANYMSKRIRTLKEQQK